MKTNIIVMLVEDHPEYREVIDLALEEEPDIELSDEFGSVEAALQCHKDRVLNAEPDIILLDLNLSGISGVEAVPHFLEVLPEANIIILTQSDDEADVINCIQRGASGYLLKSSTVDQIVQAIRDVAAGGAIIDSHIARFILQTLRSAPTERPEKNLSARELEILTHLAEGLVKKEIAEKLNISINTVVSHFVRIYTKLNVNTAASAIHRGHILGLFKK